MSKSRRFVSLKIVSEGDTVEASTTMNCFDYKPKRAQKYMLTASVHRFQNRRTWKLMPKAEKVLCQRNSLLSLVA